MSTTIDARLKQLGIVLPVAAMPAANYVPYVLVGNMLFVAGQVSQNKNGFVVGKLGLNFSLEQGYDAAKLCGIALISQLKSACDDDLNRVKRVIRLGGFVNSTSEFTDHPKVINGASDLMVAVFGDAGKHSRAAVGSSSLPFGVAVEIDGIFELAS